MKIFKNRGDIYIPKSNYKSSREARILHILLIVILIFTAVFLVLLSQKYHSAADFFGKGEVTVPEETVTQEVLPALEGKTNFLVLETDDNRTQIHYLFLVQADKQNKAYKICSLSPQTKIDGKSMYDIYEDGGGASLQTKLTEYLGVPIDYYAAFETTVFVDFVNKLGSFIYPVTDEIQYSGGKEDDTYTLHLTPGEENIDGRTLSNLLRYYSIQEKNYEVENEVLLYAITGLFNAENFEDCDSLFRLFIKSASTNITVRNFENNKEALSVYCNHNKEILLYTVNVHYDNNILTQKAVQEIKRNF